MAAGHDEVKGTKIKDQVDVIMSMIADEGYWISAQGDVFDGTISIDCNITGFMHLDVLLPTSFSLGHDAACAMTDTPGSR